MDSKELSWIVTWIGLPKLQELRNENAATWKPSPRWFRHSYIIEHLVWRFSQPMIARLITTARSLPILHEIGQILSHQRTRKELPPRFIVPECFNWSNVDMWRVTWEMIELVKVERADMGLRCKENRCIPIEYETNQSIKSDNNRQQKNTQLLAAGRNDSPGALSKVLYEEGPPTFPPPPPPPYPFTYHFWQKRYPFRIPSIDKWHPPLTAVNVLFLQMNKSLNQEVFVTLLLLQNACVMYPFWFSVLFNIFFLEKSLPIRTWSLNKKNTPFKRKPRNLPI